MKKNKNSPHELICGLIMSRSNNQIFCTIDSVRVTFHYAFEDINHKSSQVIYSNSIQISKAIFNYDF